MDERDETTHDVQMPQHDPLVGAMVQIGTQLVDAGSALGERVGKGIQVLILCAFGAGVFFATVTWQIRGLTVRFDAFLERYEDTEKQVQANTLAVGRAILPEAETRLDDVEENDAAMRERIRANEVRLDRLERNGAR